MEAYSVDTNTTYESWDDLIKAEADGYVIVAVFERTLKSGDLQSVARVHGRYHTDKKARSAAAYRRKWWKKQLREPGYENVRLLGVHVEPIWTKWSW